MYNIGPLDQLNRLYQQLKSEGGYWLGRIQRMLPGQSSTTHEMPKPDIQGTPLLPIVGGCCLIFGCCLCVVIVGAAYYAMQNLH